MTASGNDPAGTAVASSAAQDGVTPRARPATRTWWVLPYCAGALAVLVVAGLIIGLRYHPPAKTQPTRPLSAAEPKPAEMFPDALFGALTADIQKGNETAFLGMASASARPAMSTWWGNLRAIGFTTGAVIPTDSIDAVRIDGHGDGTTVVLAGTHSPLDPLAVDTSDRPMVPLAHYRIGLHFSGPGALGQITSWQPLDDTPWDAGPLYVRKAAGVVVAGPAADSALVNQVLPAAATAASYDLRLMRYIAPIELFQQGFVLFVASSDTVENGWFADDPQPRAWPPQFLGARAVQLPGPNASAENAVHLGQSLLVTAIANSDMGGLRVVLTPTEPATGAALHAETLALVRVFMLDIQGAHQAELPYAFPVKPVPSWAEEGIGVTVQALFEGNPNPTLHKYNFGVLAAALHRLPASYRRGVYPSTADLFGPSLTTDEDWGYVAASTYEYIDSSFNMARMMVSAMSVYAALPTPFGNVFKSGTNARNLKFYGIHSIRLGWQPWLAAR